MTDYENYVEKSTEAYLLSEEIKTLQKKIEYKKEKIEEFSNQKKIKEPTLENIKNSMKTDKCANEFRHAEIIKKELDEVEDVISSMTSDEKEKIESAYRLIGSQINISGTRSSYFGPVKIDKETIKAISADNKAYKINNVLGKIFRLEFIKKLGLLPRLIISFFVWMFLLGIVATIIAMPLSVILGMQINSIGTSFLLPLFGIIVVILNIFYYFKAKAKISSQYHKNEEAFRILFDNDRDTRYLSDRLDFERNRMEDEIKSANSITSMPDTSDMGPYFKLVYDYLSNEYNQICSCIEDFKKEITVVETEIADAKKKLETLKKEIDKLLQNLRFWKANKEGENALSPEDIKNIDINEGKIASSIPTYSCLNLVDGFKYYMTLKHNYSPTAIIYSDNYISGHKGRKMVADLIMQFTYGLVLENNSLLFNEYLVDFEGLDIADTNGSLKVLNTKSEVDDLLKILKNNENEIKNSKCVDIFDYNKARLSENASPMKFNIVFFNKIDYENINREDAQLFIKCRKFGFIPIFIDCINDFYSVLDSTKKSIPIKSCLDYIKEKNNVYFFVPNKDKGWVLSSRRIDEEVVKRTSPSKDEINKTIEFCKNRDTSGAYYYAAYMIEGHIDLESAHEKFVLDLFGVEISNTRYDDIKVVKGQYYELHLFAYMYLLAQNVVLKLASDFIDSKSEGSELSEKIERELISECYKKYFREGFPNSTLEFIKMFFENERAVETLSEMVKESIK